MLQPVIKITDPVRYYEYKGQPSKLTPAIDVSGSTGNKLLAPAVAGLVYRLMGFVVQGGGASAGAVGIFSDTPSGSPNIFGYITVLGNTSPPFVLPIIDSGYGETAVGKALYIAVTNQAVNGTYFYTTYTS